MTEAPTVSVAMATYNGAKYLRAQLESILGQTHPVAELVISDDGSTDGTLDVACSVLSESTASALAVTIIDGRPAGGVTANFERAISRTTHPVVVLSDQDDIWEPDRVAVTLEGLDRRSGTLLVHGDARLIDDNGRDLGRLFDTLGLSRAERDRIRSGCAFDLLMRRNVVTGATVGFRRELFDRARPFPSSWVHDEWLAMVAAAADGVDLIDRPLINYRQHDSNEIGAGRVGWADRLERLTSQGRARNRRLLDRAKALSQWVEQDPDRVTLERRQAVRQKVEHERVRERLPRRRLPRLPVVVAEARTGRYARFGRGVADVVRDLVQPLDDSAGP
ncbi:MAG: glycosyltransferase family 2 protein [Acidobacteriota bacterium]